MTATDTAARHLRLLSDVVAAVTASLELDDVLSRVAVSMASAFHADACFVYTLDPTGEQLVLGAAVGVRLAKDVPAPRLRVGDGITGWAARERMPVAIPRDAHLDPRFRHLDGLDEASLASILAVPVLTRGRLVGALNVRTREAREYDDSEVELMVTIAAQVGQAIENALLWGRSQRRIAELEALAGLGRTLTAPLDIDEALNEAVRTAAEAAHADVCALVLASAPGEAPEVAYRSSAVGPSDEALAAAAGRAPLEAPGLLAVPLETRRGSLGALVCSRASGAAFTRAERALLRSIGSQAAAGVAAARGTMRGLLAQEIHHRVKNNLQTVASLLRLAARDGDPSRALRDSVNRVLAIAAVHDLLTERRDDDVDGADLIRRLTESLGHTFGGRPFDSSLAPIVLPSRRATPLALVFSELLSNAVEHGGGRISVVLRRDGAFGELAVRDEGPGMPPDSAPGQGMAIARALAESDLGGTLVFEDADPGLRAVVRFPLQEGP